MGRAREFFELISAAIASPIAIVEPVAQPKFDGHWMWSDEQGN